MSEQQKKSKKPINLLLVDDEQEYGNVLAKRFARRAIATTNAYNGSEALQALRWRDFDVVVLDLKLGGDMDGLEVLRICKRIDKNLPVIILTGHGSAEAAKEGLALGAFDYLTKPCELDELLGKIHQATQSSEQKK